MVFTHVVNGDRAATLLDEALALPANAARRGDPVVVLHDDLTVGPLRHIDESAEARVGFWQRVLGAGERGMSQTITDAFAINDHTLKTLTVDNEGEVVFWHTRHAADQLLLRRLAYRLRNMPQRLNEIAIQSDRPIGELDARHPGYDRAAHAASLAAVSDGLHATRPFQYSASAGLPWNGRS
ncbi:DUF1835 domain-containing protein [Robbsia andropogonis]|uniref:DUF1835 domain-containing protein n=1 Tax=Robbsia andropogonis TaxID=28092 RepID=UPI003D256D1A